MDQLLDVLRYKREVLTQLLLVATIFGGFAVSGIMAFLTAPERGRARSALFVALSIAALAFIAATVLDAIMLPAMTLEGGLRSPQVVGKLLNLGDVVVWAVIVGCASLVGAVGFSGFLFSRTVGRVVLGVTGLVVLTASGSIAYLAVILSR